MPDDVLPSLRALAALGLQLVVVSNANGTLHTLADRLGLTECVNCVLDSFIEKVEKPDPRFFEIALERSGADRSSTIHVGDLYEVDVVGARAAGITPVLLDAADLYPDADCERVRSSGRACGTAALAERIQESKIRRSHGVTEVRRSRLQTPFDAALTPRAVRARAVDGLGLVIRVRLRPRRPRRLALRQRLLISCAPAILSARRNSGPRILQRHGAVEDKAPVTRVGIDAEVAEPLELESVAGNGTRGGRFELRGAHLEGRGIQVVPEIPLRARVVHS